jgi:hypothetical protein
VRAKCSPTTDVQENVVHANDGFYGVMQGNVATVCDHDLQEA